MLTEGRQMMQTFPLSRKTAADADLPDLLPAVVLARSAAAPDALAYLYTQTSGETRELRYGTLVEGARQVARGLLAAGCGHASRVALMCGHGPEFVTGLLGAFVAGCAVMPVAPPVTPAMRTRTQAILAESKCAAALIATDADRQASLEAGLFAGSAVLRIGDAAPVIELPPLATLAGDVALVQYTSGSTSSPRGVIITHGALAQQQRVIAKAVQPVDEERVVTWLPPEHDMGLIGGLLFNLWRGQSTCVLSPSAFIRRPVLWLEAISRWRATITVAPNFAYDLCVRAISEERRAGLDLSSLRVALNGAEPVRPATLERFAEAFSPCGFDAKAFLPCYGLAEASLLVSGASRGGGAVTGWFDAAELEKGTAVACAPGQGRHLASSGNVRTSGGVKIVDVETQRACPAGQVGEIWIAGDSLGSGYLGRPEESGITFGARTADGEGPYLRSGDTGFLLGGELYVTGRIKDIVLWHGRTLHAADLEQVLEGTDARMRPGRIAAHQSEDGAVTILVEVPPVRTGETAQEEGGRAETGLATQIWRRLLGQAGVEAARVVLVRPGTLLWTTSGKLKRKASLARAGDEPERVFLDWRPGGALRAQADAVRRLASERRPDATPAAAIRRFFAEWIAAVAGVAPSEVDLQQAWADQGLDSLMLTDLILDLETAMGRQLQTEQLFEHSDPAALAEVLAGEGGR